MREKNIEKLLSTKVKEYGGLSLKFISPGMDGVPDRLVLFPDSKMAFIELKRPGGKLRPLQVKRKSQLQALGFLVYCIDSIDQIGGVIDEIRAT